MKVYFIYNKTWNRYIDKNLLSDGRTYLIYGDLRSARRMANSIKKHGVGFPSKYKNDDIVVLEYETNKNHMKEV